MQSERIRATKRRQQASRRRVKKILKDVETKGDLATSEEDDLDYFIDNSVESPEQLQSAYVGFPTTNNEDSPVQDTNHDQSDRNPSKDVASLFWDNIDRLNRNEAESNSESDSDREDNVSVCRRKLLSEWALEFNIPQTALGKLLKILKGWDIDVPTDARTLLKTPRSGTIQICKKSGMDSKCAEYIPLSISLFVTWKSAEAYLLFVNFLF